MQQENLQAAGFTRYGIGQPVLRTEDPILVQGKGSYADDVNLPDQAYAVVVRSPHAHGVIKDIGIDEAKAMPGVLAVLTAADLTAYGGLKCPLPLKGRDGGPIRYRPRPALAGDKVRFVGDPVACVIAATRQQAKDAAEAVTLEVDPLPVVTRASQAAAPEAPQIYDDVPGNVALDFHYGDSDKVAAAFAAAAHVTRVDFVNSRLVVNAMEPRAAVTAYDPASGRFTLHIGCQGVFGLRAQMADILGVEPGKVHVIAAQTGGSFGMKATAYPEYVCIMHAARALGRPVKWTDERSGSFLSDHHGRDHEMAAELALDKDGKFLALRLTGYGNMGGYLGAMAPLMPTVNTVKNVASVYRTPLIELSSKCVFTNTTLVAPYRGAGRPEGNYYMERLIDTAAAETGIDRVELRRRNMIRPQEIPYASAAATTYDSGDFPAILDEALERADWKGFAARKRESKRNGKLRGIGLGSYLEVTAPPNKELGGIRFEPNGDVSLITGTYDYGQGHAAPFAQVLSSRLGIPYERIRLVQGDSDQLAIGGGSGGSRSAMASGTAIVGASHKVIAKGKDAAAQVLEASAGDIEFAAGRFTIAGTDRGIDIMALAQKVHAGLTLPDGSKASLDVTHIDDGVPSAFPNGSHVAEVEIDPETGTVAVVKYTCVNDFGTVINPMIVDGQVHGGVVQGIGQVLLERVVFDDEGQPLTGSFMDYAMPRASDAPSFATASHPVPATSNPLGVKGCGEAGCAGAMTSVTNAIVDALSEFGVRHFEMPATPARVWALIQAAKTDAKAGGA